MKFWRMATIATSLMFIAANGLPQGSLGKKSEKSNEPQKSGDSSSRQTGSSKDAGSSKQSSNTPSPYQRQRSEPPSRPSSDSGPSKRDSGPSSSYRGNDSTYSKRDGGPSSSNRGNDSTYSRGDGGSFGSNRGNDSTYSKRDGGPSSSNRGNDSVFSKREPTPRTDGGPQRDDNSRLLNPPIFSNNSNRNSSGKYEREDPGQGQLGKGRGNGNSNGSGNGSSSGGNGSSSGGNGRGNGGSNSGGSSNSGGGPKSNNGGSGGSSGGNSGGNNGSGNQGSPPLGRIDNPDRGYGSGTRSDQGGVLSKGGKNSSVYGSNNNQYDNNKSKQPPSFGRAPTNVLGGSLGDQARREDHPREVRNRWRTGYWGYNSGWCDDDFRFGWYVFDCYRGVRCVSSPWYYYPHLPGYLNYSCVSIVTFNLNPFYGEDYRWRRVDNWGYSNDYNAADYAVDDLVRAFERRDSRALGRLVPRRGNVHIWLDGHYDYSMSADSFYDLMEDNVFGTRTTSYEILSVRTYRNEAEIRARHEFIDSWGNRQSVYHWYRLERDRDGYVIRNFGTSDSRW